jgi:hypothetical protein
VLLLNECLLLLFISLATQSGNLWIHPRIAPRFLDGGEWSASRPGCFNPQGKIPWYPLDRRLGGPQSRWWRENLPAPCRCSNPDRPSCSSALYHWANPAPYSWHIKCVNIDSVQFHSPFDTNFNFRLTSYYNGYILNGKLCFCRKVFLIFIVKNFSFAFPLQHTSVGRVKIILLATLALHILLT